MNSPPAILKQFGLGNTSVGKLARSTLLSKKISCARFYCEMRLQFEITLLEAQPPVRRWHIALRVGFVNESVGLVYGTKPHSIGVFGFAQVLPNPQLATVHKFCNNYYS